MPQFDFLIPVGDGCQSPTALHPDTATRRRRAGGWLRTLRREAEITPQELAEQVGAEDGDWVLQLESGHDAVPSFMYSDFARAYDMPCDAFAKRCLMYYDPYAFEALFGSAADGVIHF